LLSGASWSGWNRRPFGTAPAGLATHGADLDVTMYICFAVWYFLVRLEQTLVQNVLLLVSPPLDVTICRVSNELGSGTQPLAIID
jgi:hypothetical protein